MPCWPQWGCTTVNSNEATHSDAPSNSIGKNSGAETKAHTLSSRKKNMPWSFQLNQTKTAAGTFFVMWPSQSYDDSQLDCVTNLQLFAEFILDRDQFLMQMKILTYISSKSGSFSHQNRIENASAWVFTPTHEYGTCLLFSTHFLWYYFMILLMNYVTHRYIMTQSPSECFVLCG